VKDRLGSVDTVTDAGGNPVETRGYDAFGKPRQGNWADAVPPKFGTIANTPQHEHLNAVALIHMNGRAYDYQLGRFLSVDPIIQFPTNSQSLNPYSYILNNPLAGTDPSGYSSLCEHSSNHYSAGTCGDMSAVASNVLSTLGRLTARMKLAGVGNGGMLSASTTGRSVAGSSNELAPPPRTGTTPTDVSAGAGNPATAGGLAATTASGARTAGRIVVTARVPRALGWRMFLPNPFLLGGILLGGDNNWLHEQIHGPAVDTCLGTCSCAGVSRNLCAVGESDADKIRMATPPMAGAAETTTPSGPDPDGEERRRQEELASMFAGGRQPTSVELEQWAARQGWTRTQTANGPAKFRDQNGVVRITIKRGSARTPGSEMPHVELRNAGGQRVGPTGQVVSRNSPENHTRIRWIDP
jgi:RHS repeat-associated protein